jgi:glycosyltransferase involved in cell wall biosynthesis
MTKAKISSAMTLMQGNILLVANFNSDIGYAWWLMENFWVQIACHYANENRKVYLIYPKIASIPQSILSAPIKIIEHNFQDQSKRGRKNLKKIIISNCIKSVYLTDMPYLHLFYGYLRLWGVTTIIDHDHTPGERTPVDIVTKIFKRILHVSGIFGCDLYIGVSEFVHKRLLSVGCPPGKCTYVHNGIMPIEVKEEYKEYAHDVFNIDKKAVIIVSVGRASVYKGLLFTIDCADAIINKIGRKDVCFLHCGEGPDLELFKNEAARRKIDDRFIFAGKRDDVPEILQSCDIAFHASKGEAFSLAILEYMSAGLTAIVPDNCGNSEAIEHKVTGFVYEPENAAMATEYLMSIINDKDMRTQIGIRARQRVAEKFTIDKMNKSFLSTVSGVL